jgi:hypothetical protein
MLLVIGPADLYPPISLSLISYIITLDLEKTNNKAAQVSPQLHYLADLRLYCGAAMHPGLFNALYI